jgi:hypothetical protein
MPALEQTANTSGDVRIEKDLSYEDYAKSPFINAGLLIAVHQESMKTVRAMMQGRINQESDALDFGTAFHSLLLENKREYVEQPETYVNTKGLVKPWTMQSNSCKAWVKSQNGNTVLTKQEIANLEGMVSAVKEEEELKPLLAGGDSELSIFVKNKGRSLKIRVDLLPKESPVVIDFKKTRDARPEKFIKQAYEYGYFIKCAMYLDVLKMAGIDRQSFWLVAVEDKEPYNVFTAKLENIPVGFLDAGRHQYRRAYAKLMKAIQDNSWPSYGSSEAELHIKPWMVAELEAQAL